MVGPPQDWLKTALEITGHFEDSADPLGAVTGDFDGMGISLGVLQWNIGSNSLQPMIVAVGRVRLLAVMPQYGSQLWDACQTNIPNGLAICRQWQNGTQLRPDAYAELKALARSEPFVDQQIVRAGRVAESAWRDTDAWAQADPAYPEPTKALFGWFFDLWTQNGGLKGLRYHDVEEFIARNGRQASDDVICDWLAGRPKGVTGYRDSNDNAKLWRNTVPDERLSLFILSYLRSQLSRPEYRADVMNRKGTIATGEGWVHREKHDLMRFFQ